MTDVATTETERGHLYVIAAPSGAGKTTLVHKLMDGDDSLRFSISYTTRPQRHTETDGKDYNFVTEDAFEAMISAGEWIAPTLVSMAARLAFQRPPSNLVVTNVPGPPFPVYMNGARMLESYPLVPLFTNQALGIALLSYDGGLYWGFNADWDAVPRLHDLVQAVEREYESLRKL